MNSYSSKFDLRNEPALKSRLEQVGFEFQTAEHSFWRASKKGVVATLYKSGKILVQGKETQEFAKEFLHAEIAIQNSLSMQQTPGSKASSVDMAAHSYSSWIGTDESGKGDYFGPLVVAGVLINPENKIKLLQFNIQDSKKLSDAEIEKTSIKIKANSIFSVVTINPAKYNELYEKFKNLNTLLAWGHARAIENILEKIDGKEDCAHAISDKFGDESLITNALMKKGRSIILEQRVRAESDLAVAAASILARNEFVQRIKKMSSVYGIGFQKGASPKVKEQASFFIKKNGGDALKMIAKIHFKTTKEL